MDWKFKTDRYKFSKRSYPALAKFMEVVSRQPDVESEASKAMKAILPKNEELLAELEEFREADRSDVIDLCDSNEDDELENVLMEIDSYSTSNDLVQQVSTTDEMLSASSDKPSSISQEEVPVHINKSYNDDIVPEIMQQLSITGSLTEEMVSSLHSDYSSGDLERLYRDLQANGIDNKSIVGLGQCLANCKNTLLLVPYIRHILLEKLKENDSEQITAVFVDFLKLSPQIICNQLAATLIGIRNGECPRPLLENLKKLDCDNKQMVLRDFVLGSSKLEKGHIPVIESLIVGPVELSVLKKLVDLFELSQQEHNGDKSFGKLLFTLLQKTEKNLHHFKQQLHSIVSSHKTTWRIKILKLLEENLNRHNSFSQTVQYY